MAALPSNLLIKKVKGNEYYVARIKRNGKRFDKSLGPVSTTTLTEAKFKLAKLLAADDIGDAKVETSDLFEDILPSALDHIREAKQWKNAKEYPQWKSSLEMYALPRLSKIPVAKIETRDIYEAIHPIYFSKTETAKRVIGRIKAVLDYCIVMKLREGPNPAAWDGNLSLLFPPRGKVSRVEHHEAPTVDELRVIVAHCRRNPSPNNALLLFIIATACRVTEARLACDNEIEGDVWHPPIERMKVEGNGDHYVPMSSLAKEAVAMGQTTGYPTGNRKPCFLFTNNGEPLCLDGPNLRIKEIVKREAGKKKPTAHGIRSAFRDWCGREGVSDNLAEIALAHSVGNSVEQAYHRERYIEQRRTVMQRWAEAVGAI